MQNTGAFVSMIVCTNWTIMLPCTNSGHDSRSAVRINVTQLMTRQECLFVSHGLNVFKATCTGNDPAKVASPALLATSYKSQTCLHATMEMK